MSEPSLPSAETRPPQSLLRRTAAVLEPLVPAAVGLLVVSSFLDEQPASHQGIIGRLSANPGLGGLILVGIGAAWAVAIFDAREQSRAEIEMLQAERSLKKARAAVAALQSRIDGQR